MKGYDGYDDWQDDFKPTLPEGRGARILLLVFVGGVFLCILGGIWLVMKGG